MSLYPSLEEMKISQMVTAQMKTQEYNAEQQLTNQAIAYPQATAPGSGDYPSPTSGNYPGMCPGSGSYPSLSPKNGPALSPGSGHYPATAPGPVALYPALGDYMGLELSSAMIAANMPEYSQTIVPVGVNSHMIAPLSGQTKGLQKAQVTNAIRELTLCKDKDNKVGLRVKSVDNGVFVCLVVDKSPASLAGLRFGDQILQINGENVAGYSMDKVHELFKKSPVNGITVAVRDRPFERTITLHKDSTNHVGCLFKNGKIMNIVKDSSAARNGLLINHQILEVEGQNVIGLKDKEIAKILDQAGSVVTFTVIPSIIYDHMIKKMSTSLIKNLMDHSI